MTAIFDEQKYQVYRTVVLGFVGGSANGADRHVVGTGYGSSAVGPAPPSPVTLGGIAD